MAFIKSTAAIGGVRQCQSAKEFDELRGFWKHPIAFFFPARGNLTYFNLTLSIAAEKPQGRNQIFIK